MEHNEIVAEIRKILGQTLERSIAEEESPSRQSEPNWDSLRHVELLFSLEDRFEIRFDGEEMPFLDSLPKLAEAVGKQLASQYQN